MTTHGPPHTASRASAPIGTAIGTLIGPLINPLIGAVYPPVCPLTGEDVAEHGTLAPAAWTGLTLLSGPRCAACGRPVLAGPAPRRGEALTCDLCLAMPRPWSRGAAAMRYDGSGRAMILRLKRADRLDLAPPIARWMLRAGPELVTKADLVIPVPLHWRRLLFRRTNQSAELARALCQVADRDEAYAPTLLRRVRATPSQGGRNRAERIANVAGAFSATRLGRAMLPGRRVLLIDDVMTTGATLAASAEACLGAGAAAVNVLVAALVDGAPTKRLTEAAGIAEDASDDE